MYQLKQIKSNYQSKKYSSVKENIYELQQR